MNISEDCERRNHGDILPDEDDNFSATSASAAFLISCS